MVGFVLGRIFLIEAALMLFPMGCAAIYGEWSVVLSFLWPALIVLALLCPLSPLPLTAMLLLYGALDVLYAAKAALEAPCGKLLTFICLPFLFPVVHIVYGTGTLCGLLTGKAESHA